MRKNIPQSRKTKKERKKEMEDTVMEKTKTK